MLVLPTNCKSINIHEIFTIAINMEFVVLKHLSITLAFEVERFPDEMYRVSHLDWEAPLQYENYISDC